jgi:hypothetical protein
LGADRNLCVDDPVVEQQWSNQVRDGRRSEVDRVGIGPHNNVARQNREALPESFSLSWNPPEVRQDIRRPEYGRVVGIGKLNRSIRRSLVHHEFVAEVVDADYFRPDCLADDPDGALLVQGGKAYADP